MSGGAVSGGAVSGAVVPVEVAPGMPALDVTGPAATARVLLQGAHVLSWQPAGGRPGLWLSSATRWEPGVPVRGGVPVCFPWFGPHGHDRSAPAHGFARRVPWSLVGSEVDGDVVRVVLGLEDDEATRASAWPHRFSARLAVAVGRELGLALTVTNTDDEAWTYEAALHTYLRVPGLDGTRVLGLEDAPWDDRVDGGRHAPAGTPVTFPGQVDRTYAHGGRTVLDTADGTTEVLPAGASATVVWNPGAEVAAGMADVGPGEHRGFVCVETAAVAPDAVRLEPGEQHTLTVTYRQG